MASLGRRLRERSGIALVTSIGLLGLLSIAGSGLVLYANGNARTAEFSNESASARNLADAGMNYARSILWSASDPTSPAAVGTGSLSLEGGTVTYAGAYSSPTQTWTLTGTGTVSNPTGAAAPITRTASSKVAITTGPGTIWQYLYSDSTTGCMTVDSNATIAAPLFVRGSLCLDSNARITGSPLHVGGTLTTSSNSRVGSAGTPIASANIVGGCTGGNPNPHTCGPADDVYATSITQTPNGLTKPSIDLPYWYQNASPGPRNPCTTGSMPGGFDSGSGGTAVPPNPNRTRPAFDLLPDTGYDCRTATGRLSWTPGNPGTLTIAGTIFFDGDVYMDGNSYAVYSGRATIYASGRIWLDSNAKLCGIANCTSSWNPSVNGLVVVAGHPTAQYGFELDSNSVYQGGAYVVTDYSSNSNSVNWGPVIARQLHLDSNSAQAIPIVSLPPGAPGGTTTLTNVPGSYVD